MKRDLGWLVTLVLALLALGKGPRAVAPVASTARRPALSAETARSAERPASVPATEATPEATAKAPERSATPPASAKDECGEGEALIRDYQRLYWPTPSDPAPAAAAAAMGHFLYMIALVPDPEESGHTDYFDAVLDGIEEAAAEGLNGARRERYVRDHYWLPWSASDKKKRRARCWEQKPGVILYRPTLHVESSPALVVLLVGETPTWGVRADVLAQALASADDACLPALQLLCGREAPEATAPSASDASPAADSTPRWYRILGPTFSGSAPSLRAALERYVARQERKTPCAAKGPRPAASDASVCIASGTATGETVQATLERGLDASGAEAAAGQVAPALATPRKTSLHVRYVAAVPSYPMLLKAMLSFLSDAGGKSALLSESGTAYGEQASPVDGKPPEAPPSAPDLWQVFKFPPNLISLRNAYLAVDPATTDEAQPITRAPAQGAAHAEAQGELSDQTPIEHDLALAEVLRQLSRERVRNVGISATDARDVIFMAERVGRQLPDVRLFTIGFDLRYLHPQHAEVLNGLLVAHAAPPARLEASTVRENPMTQRVLAAGEFLFQGIPPHPRARVSLVGNGALRQIGMDLDDTSQWQAVGVQVPRSYWLSYGLSLSVLLGGLLVLIGPGLPRLLPALGRFPLESPLSRSFLRRRGALHSWLRPLNQTDLAADDASASLGLVSLLVGAPLMLTPALGLQSNPVLCVLAWALPGYVLLLSCAHWLPRARGATLSARVLGLLMLAVALASIGIGTSPLRETSVWILSGASPMVGGLVNLSMLLVVGWGWRVRLRSLDLLLLGAAPGSCFEELEPPLARVFGHEPGSQEPCAVLQLERHLLRVLRRPWQTAPLWPALSVAALLASIALVSFLKPILSFESGRYHWLLLAVAVGSLLPILTCFSHLIATARALLRLLRAIESPSLLKALRRIPPALAFRLESELVHARRGANQLLHPVCCLKELAQRNPTCAASAKRCDEALQDQLRFEAGIEFQPKTQPARLVEELLTEAGRCAREHQSVRTEELAENFRACLVAIFVARYLQQLRSMVAPVVLGCVLAILMTSFYFVQPRHLLATTCFLWVTAIVLAVVVTYLTLARDALLSAIGKTEEGTVDLSWRLAARIAAVTVVPLASFVASQYPEAVFWLTSLLGNLTQFVQ